MLVCEKCGSHYFIEKEVSKFNDIPIGAGQGYRPLMDRWKIYQCLNEDCGHVHVPSLTSMSAPKSETKQQEEILSTLEGKPKEIPDEPRRMPKPGEIIRG